MFHDPDLDDNSQISFKPKTVMWHETAANKYISAAQKATNVTETWCYVHLSLTYQCSIENRRNLGISHNKGTLL